MARKRDYAAEYAARQRRARAQGFAGYYEQRTRRSPGAAKPSTSELARRRGHRSRSDLLRDVRDGDIVSVVSSNRRADGSYTRIDISVLGADGEERTYQLRGKQLADERIAELDELMAAAGAIVSPAYPLKNLYRDLGEQEDAEAA